jgi:hypothetical protein
MAFKLFMTVAEELHFARTALWIVVLAVLFVHTSRSTRLTRAGKLFLEHVPRVFTSLQQARDSVKAASNGFHGQLHIALSDDITPSRLPALLAMCWLGVQH